MERDALKVFDRATNLNLNLNDLNNDFKDLFPTFSLSMHDVDWRSPSNINKGRWRKDRPSDNMSILHDPLVELIMQDIINANSVRAAKPFFNISFDIKSMANFYAMGFSSFLTYYHFKERKNSSIEANTS